ncbi:hypothetical protein HU200_058820 [Digitaria exilis]|uniref:DUF1618 domain-containing protein n=1 Tax=Digitaria exilis TaxID=1010633 RepID=A0A835A930_9POAL|nr:hypothetical protein HU200_058820 [Digitaria exilis]
MLDRHDSRSNSVADAKTVAEALDSTGRNLRVSFRLASPPASSFLHYDHGVGSTAPTNKDYDDDDDCDEDYDDDCDDYDENEENHDMQIIATHGDSVLLEKEHRVHRFSRATYDYFVYRASSAAAARPASLSLLPERRFPMKCEEGRPILKHPREHMLFEETTGLLRRSDDELLVADLRLQSETQRWVVLSPLPIPLAMAPTRRVGGAKDQQVVGSPAATLACSCARTLRFVSAPPTPSFDSSSPSSDSSSQASIRCPQAPIRCLELRFMQSSSSARGVVLPLGVNILLVLGVEVLGFFPVLLLLVQGCSGDGRTWCGWAAGQPAAVRMGKTGKEKDWWGCWCSFAVEEQMLVVLAVEWRRGDAHCLHGGEARREAVACSTLARRSCRDRGSPDSRLASDFRLAALALPDDDGMLQNSRAGRTLPTGRRTRGGRRRADGGGGGWVERMGWLLEKGKFWMRHLIQCVTQISQVRSRKQQAELCVLRHSGSCDYQWELIKDVPIVFDNNGSSRCSNKLQQQRHNRFMCWVDYIHGLLLCDMDERRPKLRYL